MDAKKTFTQVKMAVLNSSREDTIDDDADLAALGYKAEFKREFTNLSTISFAFSIMGGLCLPCWLFPKERVDLRCCGNRRC